MPSLGKSDSATNEAQRDHTQRVWRQLRFRRCCCQRTGNGIPVAARQRLTDVTWSQWKQQSSTIVEIEAQAPIIRQTDWMNGRVLDSVACPHRTSRRVASRLATVVMDRYIRYFDYDLTLNVQYSAQRYATVFFSQHRKR